MAEQGRLQEPALRIALDETVIKARRVEALRPVKDVADLLDQAGYQLDEQGDPTGRALREFARIDLLIRAGDRWTDGNPIGDIDIPPALVNIIQTVLAVTHDFAEDTRPEPVNTRYAFFRPISTVTNVSLGHGFSHNQPDGSSYLDMNAYRLVFHQPAPQSS